MVGQFDANLVIPSNSSASTTIGLLMLERLGLACWVWHEQKLTFTGTAYAGNIKGCIAIRLGLLLAQMIQHD